MTPNKRWLGTLSQIKRLSLLSALLFQVFQIAAAPGDTVERISRKDLKPAKVGMPEEEQLTKNVVLEPNINMVDTIEV